MSEPELELVRRIYNDDWHYEVGPDADGLGLVELRLYDGTDRKECRTRMTFQIAEARLIADALMQCAMEVKAP